MNWAPLEQFEIFRIIPGIRLLGFDIALTNSLILLILFWVGLSLAMPTLGSVNVLRTHWSNFIGALGEIPAQLVSDSLNEKREIYFPLLYTIFLFILGSNMLGLIPYSFTITSHIIVTFLLSFSIFIGMNIITTKKHGQLIFSLFLPSNTGFFLALLLVPVELVSYIAKPISLGVRLFINLMAGHTLLKVILMFSWNLLIIDSLQIFFIIIPVFILLFLVGLESGVAFIQAYVFLTLTSIYLNESENLH